MKRKILKQMIMLVPICLVFLLIGCTSGSITLTSNSDTNTGNTNAFPTSKIVFESSGNIHIINSDGTNEKWLDSGENPAWSPDGEKIAYCRDDGIYIINIDGTGRFKVAPWHWGFHYREYSFVVWVPDGGSLLYYTDESSENIENYILWSVKSDGSSTVKIIEGIVCSAPTFSPSGKQIAIVIENTITSGFELNLYVMDADGTNIFKTCKNIIQYLVCNSPELGFKRKQNNVYIRN